MIEVRKNVLTILLFFGFLQVAQADPVVLELFTSQGCSSCPPADRLLTELQTDPEIIALSFHVTYWDRLGWADPFATNAGTLRQYDYAEAFKTERVFTPQLIVNGTQSFVGSNRAAITKAVADAKLQKNLLSFKITKDKIELPNINKQILTTVETIDYTGINQTDVTAGENANEHIVNAHSVKTILIEGNWDGKAKTFITKPPASGLKRVVLIRDKASRQVLGAQRLD